MVVDLLGLAGIGISPPPADAIDRLARRGIAVAPAARVIDLPMGRADAGSYAAIVQALRASEECDLVLAVLGSNAAHDLQSTRDRVPAGHARDTPLAVFAAPRAEASLALLQERGIAAFRTPEACADAISAYCTWRAPRKFEPPAADSARAVAADLPAAAGMLNAHRSAMILGRLGIAFAPSCCLGVDDAAPDIPFPVAAKMLSPDLPHKTAAGAVVLGIADARGLAAAVADMRARVRARHPHARIEGVLVQSMQTGSSELLVGYRRDPQVGPIVLVGSGGVHAELGGAHVLHVAPVDKAEAMEMLGAVPDIAALRGSRNLRHGDLDAVAEVVHRLSLLALLERVLEAEINPLLVRSDGALALDARMRLA
jgi:acyl-CoA synthetase (NDP forming)